MKFLQIAGAAMLMTTAAFSQKRDQMVEMQRDIALLQDQIRTLDKSQNDKLDALHKTLQQAIDNQSKIIATVNNLQIGLNAQQKALTTPVATIGSKVDEMATEFGGVREQLAEINNSIKKMQAQMTDMSSAIKILQAPPSAPGSDPTAAAPPPGMNPQGLYDGARQARSSGSFDLALQQFNDYLRYYGQTDLAPSAQFYIGEIHYSQSRYDDAVKAFDQVLEKYPEGPRTLDAMYLKGMALSRKGDTTAAIAEFRSLTKQSPNSEQAAKARDALKRLAGASAPAPKKKK